MKRYYQYSILCSYSKGLRQVIEPDEDLYIDEWQNVIHETPRMGWDFVFTNILADFIRYAYSEESSDDWGETLCEKYTSGGCTAADILEKFDEFVENSDFNKYMVH